MQKIFLVQQSEYHHFCHQNPGKIWTTNSQFLTEPVARDAKEKRENKNVRAKPFFLAVYLWLEYMNMMCARAPCHETYQFVALYKRLLKLFSLFSNGVWGLAFLTHCYFTGLECLRRKSVQTLSNWILILRTRCARALRHANIQITLFISV